MKTTKDMLEYVRNLFVKPLNEVYDDTDDRGLWYDIPEGLREKLVKFENNEL